MPPTNRGQILLRVGFIETEDDSGLFQLVGVRFENPALLHRVPVEFGFPQFPPGRFRFDVGFSAEPFERDAVRRFLVRYRIQSLFRYDGLRVVFRGFGVFRAHVVISNIRGKNGVVAGRPRIERATIF